MTAQRRPGRPGYWLVAGLAIAGLGLAGYFGLGSEPGRDDGGIPDPALVAEGERVYAENCASCHGAALEGQPDWRTRLPTGGLPAPPHDETGHTWHHPDQQLFELTKYGGQHLAPAGFQSNMPGFGEQLTDREIRAALAYIRGQWPLDIQQRQRRTSERAQ